MCTYCIVYMPIFSGLTPGDLLLFKKALCYAVQYCWVHRLYPLCFLNFMLFCGKVEMIINADKIYLLHALIPKMVLKLASFNCVLVFDIE